MMNAPLAQATSLGFVGLNAVNADAMRRYYEDVLGLSPAQKVGRDLYFSCGGEHHAVSLHMGDGAGLRHIGLKIAGNGPLGDVAEALERNGVKARLTRDPVPGVASGIELADPEGYKIYLYRDVSPAAATFSNSGIRPIKLGHLALYVRDPQAAAEFYTAVLGFRWSDWVEDKFVFMRCGCDHHTLNFLRAARRGLFHVAFQMRDWAHLGEACDLLARHKFKLLCGPGRHGLGHNLYLYHRDPDGNIVEMFADMDLMSNEQLGYFDPRPHHEDFPQRPKIWPDTPETGDQWGVPVPAGFLD